MAGVGRERTSGEARKYFFFEKKKQKTFARFYRGRSSRLG
jgi:hypothetical protein